MEDGFSFIEFFNLRLRQKGFSLKKLSDISGIALKHLENLSEGKTAHLPPAPYLRGYVSILADILEFDADEWWKRLKVEIEPRTSGQSDALPENRFSRRSNVRGGFLIGGIVLLVVLLVVIFRLPAIIGQPDLVITVPAENGVTVSSEDFVLKGAAENADQVTINNEAIQIDSEGNWGKSVLLQRGVNVFEIRARKFLGRETATIRQIFYEPSTTPGDSLPPPDTASSSEPEGSINPTSTIPE